MDLHFAVLGKENTDIFCRYLCREAFFPSYLKSANCTTTKKKKSHHVCSRIKTHLVTKIEFGRGVISSSKSKSGPGASAKVSTCPPTAVSGACTDRPLSTDAGGAAEGMGGWVMDVSDAGNGDARLKAGMGGTDIVGNDEDNGNDMGAGAGAGVGTGAGTAAGVVLVTGSGSGLGLGLSKTAFRLEGSASPLCHGPATTLAGLSASPVPILTYCSGSALSFRRFVYEFPAATTAILWVRT